MLSRISKLCLAFLFVLSFSAIQVSAEPHSFTLHNRTGADLYKLYLAHHSSADWDENEDLLGGAVMMNGAELTITLNKEATSWDIRVESKSGGSLEWSDVPLNGSTDVVLEANGVARVK